MRCKQLVLLILVLYVVVGSSAPVSFTIARASQSGFVTAITNFDAAGNQAMRFDVDGNAVDAHDGGIALFGSTYYLYGTSYNCGWETFGPVPFCGFKVYSSTDLVHWIDRGSLFDPSTPYWRTSCLGPYGCYRPHVVYNASTQRYVLWINSNNVNVGYHVFESTQPTGPFVEQSLPQLAVNNDGPAKNGDENLFVDDDGTAYLTYTDWSRGGDIIVEQLDAKYETGTGRFVRLGLVATEAPSMFKRNGLYYITASDPNCPYCTGTGTSYLTATNPLGPWTGAEPVQSPYWQIQNGALLVNGADAGLSVAGGNWTDYHFSFDTQPLTATGGAYAQSGWVFRALDARDGYLWSLTNKPTFGTASSFLTTARLQNGQIQAQRVLPLTFTVSAGSWYHVVVDVVGQTITTTVNGLIVDVTQDTTYARGRVGFDESAASGERAAFRNVAVTSLGGSPLLADNLAAPSDLFQFDPPVPRNTPVNITTTSCAGQPTNVAMLPGTNGPIYLYQSDLWDGAWNEGLANYYWAPLSFGSDGSIQPIMCAATVSLELAIGSPGSQNMLPDIDQSSGVDGFRTACNDIGGPGERLQTFTPSRNGLLTSISFTTFQNTISSPTPNAPLVLDVVGLDNNMKPTYPLASIGVPQTTIGWSARNITVQPNIDVSAGVHYGILLHSATTQGCYGFAYNDSNSYSGGEEFVSTDGRNTFQLEMGRVLKFAMAVSSTAAIATSTPIVTDTSTPTNTSIPTSTPAPSSTAQPTNTSAPAFVATSTNTPSLTPTSTKTTVPTSTSTAVITPTLSVTPTLSTASSRVNTKAPSRRTSKHPPVTALVLNVHVSHGSMVSGQLLSIFINTTPYAHVTITFRVAMSKVTIAGKGKHRRHIVHLVILYQSKVEVKTGSHGRVTDRLRITYRSAHSTPAILSVSVSLEHRTITRHVPITIWPPHSHSRRPLGRKTVMPTLK